MGSSPIAVTNADNFLSAFLFMSTYYTYILYSEKFDRHYIGQTNNLESRLSRHNNKFEKSTSPYAPWKLLWSKELPSRREAMILEKKLKNLNSMRLSAFIVKHS